MKEIAMGAFILPNKEIPDGADLRSFIAPGELLLRVCRADNTKSRPLSALRALCSSTRTSRPSRASSVPSPSVRFLCVVSTMPRRTLRRASSRSNRTYHASVTHSASQLVSVAVSRLQPALGGVSRQPESRCWLTHLHFGCLEPTARNLTLRGSVLADSWHHLSHPIFHIILAMAPYLFPYPITGPVAFSNILLDRSQAYTTELADATVARTRLQVALKAAAGGEPGGSALAVLEVSYSALYIADNIGCAGVLPVSAQYHHVH